MKDVIQKVLKGDRDAYRAIVKEYGSFVGAYEHLRDFKLDQDFAPWIKGIARNKLLMHLRRSYQHGEALEKLRAKAAQEVFEDVTRRQEGEDAQAIDRLRHCI